jgi:hypothetical protein
MTAIPFNWTGLIVAPLIAPLIFSALLAFALAGSNPALLFVILMLPACVVSYGTTIVLFLPALAVMAARGALTGISVAALGTLLGAVVYVPLTWLAWLSSGPNSGPPDEHFFAFLARWAADPLAAMYPLAGLITAAAYWWLTTRRGGAPPAQRAHHARQIAR